jgi:hypothetical protein
MANASDQNTRLCASGISQCTDTAIGTRIKSHPNTSDLRSAAKEPVSTRNYPIQHAMTAQMGRLDKLRGFGS